MDTNTNYLSWLLVLLCLLLYILNVIKETPFGSLYTLQRFLGCFVYTQCFSCFLCKCYSWQFNNFDELSDEICICLVLAAWELGNGFQYVSTSQGSSLAEVMGVDFKSNLKAFTWFIRQKIKEDSVETLGELILLQVHFLVYVYSGKK